MKGRKPSRKSFFSSPSIRGQDRIDWPCITHASLLGLGLPVGKWDDSISFALRSHLRTAQPCSLSTALDKVTCCSCCFGDMMAGEVRTLRAICSWACLICSQLFVEASVRETDQRGSRPHLCDGEPSLTDSSVSCFVLFLT